MSLNSIKNVRALVASLASTIALLTILSCSKLEDKLRFLNPELGTDEAPRVVGSTPVPGQKGVQKDQAIEIVFSKDMNQQNCIGAFSIQPALPGVFDVSGPVFRFTPSQPFQNGETYLFSMNRQCEDVSGRDLAENYYASFAVGAEIDPPSILSGQGRRNPTGCLPTDPLQTIVDFGSNTYQELDYCENTPIVVNFSEAMDRGSVERNFSVIPSMVGAFVWNAGGAQLEFRPRDVLENGVTYVVTIGDGATDLSENNLTDVYTFSFTIGAESERPRLVQVDGLVANPDCTLANATNASVLFPATGLRNASGVCSSIVTNAVNSPIVLDFSEDMDTARSDGSFSIYPVTNGTKTWSTSPFCGQTQGTCTGNTSRLTFTPIEPLQNSTTYTVTMQGDARDASANMIGSNQTFSFTVGQDHVPPTVLAVEADKAGDCDADAESALNNLDINVCNQAAQQRIRVRFSEAMDPSVTLTAFSIFPDVPGSLSWTAGNTELNFIPSSNLENNKQYRVTISTGARDLSSNQLATEYILYFTTGSGGPADQTPPAIVDIRSDLLGSGCDGNASESIMGGFTSDVCTDNAGTGQNALIEVQFSEAVDPTMTASAFSISPAVSGIVTVAGNTLSFRSSQALDPDRQYTISVSTTARDLAGNRLQDSLLLYFQTTASGGYPGVTSATVGVGAAPCTGGVQTDFYTGTILNACELGNSIHLFFTEPMNHASTESAFALNPFISGSFQWISATELRFTPDSPMQYGKRYTVTISNSARDLQGHALSSPFSASYVVGALDSTPPTVTAVRMEQAAPPSGDGCVGTPDDVSVGSGSLTTSVCRSMPIDIEFSEPMNQSSTISATSVSLATVSTSWIAPNILRIIPVGAGFDSNSSHNLTISTSASDLAGNRLTSDFALSFSVENTSPRVVAVGLESHGTGCDAIGDAGGNGTANPGNCWWAEPLSIGSPSDYRMIGENSACARGYAGDTIGTRDNLRIIFNQAMDTASVINALSVRRIGYTPSAFSIGNWVWSNGNTVLTISFTHDPYLPACDVTRFDIGLTNEAIPGYPLLILEIDRTARNASGEALSSTFSFSFEGD